jgi:hypothetical protein
MVNASRRPIDFKVVDAEHVKLCAGHRRCGICGGKIRRGPLAFLGPDDGRRCFADPWMHEACARLAMEQCPFLAGRRDWREDGGPLLDTYSEGMALFTAPDGRAHRGPLMEWHFEAVGELARAERPV